MSFTTAELEFSIVCPIEKCFDYAPALSRKTTRAAAWDALLDHLKEKHGDIVKHRIIRETIDAIETTVA